MKPSNYFNSANELRKQVPAHECESLRLGKALSRPVMAKVDMLLALARPISREQFLKNDFNLDQPRDEHGRWTGESNPQYADSGTIMTDANVNNNASPEAHILDDSKTFIGNKGFMNDKGNHECVVFAQKAGGAPLTSEWIAGDYISPNNPPPIGTWVATFNSDEKYYGHIGVFNGYEEDGTLKLIDQFNSKGGVGETKYRPKPSDYSDKISNDPREYRIVKW